MYWIDHVLKHKDTAHLKSGSAYLTWYELYSLDVLAILAVIIWIFVKTFKYLIRKIKQKLVPPKNKLFPATKSWQKEKVINSLKCD